MDEGESELTDIGIRNGAAYQSHKQLNYDTSTLRKDNLSDEGEPRVFARNTLSKTLAESPMQNYHSDSRDNPEIDNMQMNSIAGEDQNDDSELKILSSPLQIVGETDNVLTKRPRSSRFPRSDGTLDTEEKKQMTDVENDIKQEPSTLQNPVKNNDAMETEALPDVLIFKNDDSVVNRMEPHFEPRLRDDPFCNSMIENRKKHDNLNQSGLLLTNSINSEVSTTGDNGNSHWWTDKNQQKGLSNTGSGHDSDGKEILEMKERLSEEVIFIPNVGILVVDITSDV